MSQTQYLGLRVQNDDAELKLLTFLATQQALRCYLLFKDETPVTFFIGHQFNGCFHLDEIGYDRAFAKHSPGQVLFLKILDDLLAHNTPDWLDFGGGDAQYKRTFSNHASRSGNMLLVPHSFRARTKLGYLKLCHALKIAARSILEKSGLKTKVRQFIRRGAIRKTSR